MKFWWLMALCLAQMACASRISKSTLVLEYADFGPQAMAYHVLGPKNRQWDPATPIPFGEQGVQVVVYKDVRLEEVHEHFPVQQETNQDYRYLQYGEALNYLDAKIAQNLLKRVTVRLQATRSRILAAFE